MGQVQQLLNIRNSSPAAKASRYPGWSLYRSFNSLSTNQRNYIPNSARLLLETATGIMWRGLPESGQQTPTKGEDPLNMRTNNNLESESSIGTFS
jgi:hypothetical protein